MKKVLVTLILTLSLFGLISVVAVAEEVPTEDTPTEEIIEDEVLEDEEFISSELGSYFETEVKPYLLDAGISLMGFIGSCLTLLMAVRKFLNTHKEEINKTVKKVKDTLEDEVKNLKEQNDKLIEENKELLKKNKVLFEDASRVQEINDDITKLKRCFSVIACNDPKLVSNGQAKFIAEELGTNEKDKKEQVSI